MNIARILALARLVRGTGGATSWEDLGSKYGAGYALPETTPAFNETEGYFTLAKPFTIFEGETYTVNWNGVDYTCECVSATFSGLPILGLGNIGAVTNGEPTTEPFAIGVILEEYRDQAPFAVGIIPLDNSVSVTLSVYGYTEIITPVPEKYLENGRYVVRFTPMPNHSNGFAADKSFDEALSVLKNGSVPVVAYINDTKNRTLYVLSDVRQSGNEMKFSHARVANNSLIVTSLSWTDSDLVSATFSEWTLQE